MTFNGISKINGDLGDYILLRDYGQEGMAVGGQYATLDEAMSDLCSGEGTSPATIVKLVRVEVLEES